ncbi:MAG: sodium:proton antiporter [Rhodopirellula sp.]|nr:sodium:proton antiporter [Rhodopirellula sp.]
MEHAERILLGLSSILVLGIGAQWIAWRLKLPSILLLLAFGFLAGPVSGWLDPHAMFGELLFPLISLCVGLILFEGSLGLKFEDVRGVGGSLQSLLTVGVLVTWCVVALAARWILGVEWPIAILLGSMLTVTGPTVVGPLLRHIRPTGRTGPIARWEGIVIDPVGAILAVLTFEAVELGSGGLSSAFTAGLLGLIKTAIASGIIGWGAAQFLAYSLKRHAVPDHLESPVALMIVVAVFVASNHLQHEAGLLTVTVMGIVLANRRDVDVRHILEFKENLSVLLISSLFILLAARVDLHAFEELGWRGPLFLAAVILIARPLSVFAATLRSRLRLSEKLFLAWLAPRGIVAAAVASVFALRLGDDGAALVPATFLVIVGTVVVYGLTAFPLARRLGLAVANPQGVLIASAHPGARAIAAALKAEGIQIALIDSNRDHVHAANLEGLDAAYANVLSDEALDRIELGGLGYFLALTPNSEVNSLAALRFSELFGRSNVFRLSAPPRVSSRQTASGHHHRGNVLFDNALTFEELDHRFEAGATIKATHLTDEFTWDDFQREHGESATPLFVTDAAHKLTIVTPDNPTLPKSGERVIALVDAAAQVASA